MVAQMRAELFREKKEKEPWRCPGCGQIRTGKTCECGYVLGAKASRPVVTMEGDMKEMIGDIHRPRRVDTRPAGVQLWEKMYFRSLRGKGIKSFAQARALYAYENNWMWPDKRWPLMPMYEEDFFRLVGDVPRERLR
jgi:hypothetical protein